MNGEGVKKKILETRMFSELHEKTEGLSG